MSFRRRLLLLFALTVLVSVAAVTGIVSVMTRRAFDRANDERTAVLVAQFRREFTRRRDEVRRRVQAAAASSAAERMGVAAAQNSPDYSSFLDDAQVLAEAQRLDFLEFADDRGTIDLRRRSTCIVADDWRRATAARTRARSRRSRSNHRSPRPG